jgi:hypothetical protein
MNIEDANKIPLQEVLSRINATLVRERGKNLYYLLPLRDEKTASFHVNTNRNLWYDHGDGIGGDCAAFACAYLKYGGEDCTMHDGLRWLKNMTVIPFSPRPFLVADSSDTVWKIIRVEPLEHLALIRYVEGRGIPFEIAEKQLVEVYFKNPQNNNKMYALGFQNEDNGYELRNKYLKSCIAPKTITFIRGTTPKPESIHLFEGFMDYLTYLTIKKGAAHDHDVIVLNSVNCLNQALPYINGYGYKIACTWMDNDKPGSKVTALLNSFFSSQQGLVHKPMNNVYKNHKDVNAWHMHTLNLTI